MSATNYTNIQSTQPLVVRTGLATSAISLGEVTALDHELLDDTVESRPFIAESLLPSREGAEVLGGLGDGLAIETNDDAANGLVALRDIEVDLVGDLGSLCSLGGLGEEEQAHSEQHSRGHEQPPEIEHFGNQAMCQRM